jgi:adenosylhomocysteine nucleosidase
MAKSVIVYSQEGCSACDREKEYLSGKGIAFEERDIRKNRQYLEELIDGGYNSTPVTLIDGKAVVGFDPKALDGLLAG